MSLVHHHALGEHAAVPANVLEFPRGLAVVVAHPVARVAHDVQFAVRDRWAGNGGPSCRASPSLSPSRRFARRGNQSSRAAARGSSSSSRRRNFAVRLPVEIFGQKPVFRRVVAERVKQRVRHVRLEAQCLRPIDHLQQLDHVLPAMHAAPADLPFRRQPFAVIFGNVARLRESLRDALRIRLRILRPFRGAAESMRIMP